MTESSEHEVPKTRKTLEEMRMESIQAEGGGNWKCSKCGCKDFRVTRTWFLASNKKRVRECRNCGHTLTTCEVPVPDTYGYTISKPE